MFLLDNFDVTGNYFYSPDVLFSHSINNTIAPHGILFSADTDTEYNAELTIRLQNASVLRDYVHLLGTPIDNSRTSS